MIFFKKEPVLGVDLESAINNAVFPGLQVRIFSFCYIASCPLSRLDFIFWLLWSFALASLPISLLWGIIKTFTCRVVHIIIQLEV